MHGGKDLDAVLRHDVYCSPMNEEHFISRITLLNSSRRGDAASTHTHTHTSVKSNQSDSNIGQNLTLALE